MPPRRTRWFRRDDGAASEVVGFVLMFALSSVVLVTSVQTFATSKDSADGVVAAVELRGVANRVSARVVQAALLSEDFPNATMTVELRLPAQIKDQSYWVGAANDTNGNRIVKSITQAADVEATASTFNVANQDVTLTGGVYSGDQAVIVRVAPSDRQWDFTAGETPGTTIRIKGVYD